MDPSSNASAISLGTFTVYYQHTDNYNDAHCALRAATYVLVLLFQYTWRRKEGQKYDDNVSYLLYTTHVS